MKTIFHSSALDAFDLSTKAGRIAFSAHISCLNALRESCFAEQSNPRSRVTRFCAVAASVADSGGFPSFSSQGCGGASACDGAPATAGVDAQSIPVGNHGDNDMCSSSLVVA